jgi:hypothetical protein
MKTSEQLKQLEAQQRELADKIAQLRNKIEQEKAKIEIKQPVVSSEGYWYIDTHGLGTYLRQTTETIFQPHQYKSLVSTNKVQMVAFHDAFCVMWDLRKQKGIAVPNSSMNRIYWTVRYNINTGTLQLDSFIAEGSSQVAPAFETHADLNNAIAAVGLERVKQAFKTLLFMTPESRGEVDSL